MSETVTVDMRNVVPRIAEILDEEGVSDAARLPGIIIASFMVQTLPALNNTMNAMETIMGALDEDDWDDDED